MGTGNKFMPYEKATHNSTCPAPATHAVNIHGFLVLVLTTEKDLKTDERVHVFFDPNRVHIFGPEQQEED
jgi:hypothetical protein